MADHDCIRYMREQDFARIAATPQAEEAWTEHANELAAGTLLTQANSWFVGANIPGKKRAFLLYTNSAPASPKTSFLLSSSQLRKRVRKLSCSGAGFSRFVIPAEAGIQSFAPGFRVSRCSPGMTGYHE